MKEQASYLGSKTKNLVNADVRISRSRNDFPIIEELDPTDSSSEQVFRYNFYITAPALKNYRYRLFTISFDIGLYPVIFFLDGEIQKQINPRKNSLEAKTETEYIEILGKIFNSDRTKLVINSLISQSGGLDDENQ